MKKTGKHIFYFLLFLVIISLIPFKSIFEPKTNKVGLITIDYPIVSSSQFNEELDYLIDRGDINDIIIRLNTPGGGVASSQEIYSRIIAEKNKSDISFITSMESVAASGGYYIAIATDKIFANPGSITGSIGVIMEYPVIDELLKTIGIEYITVKSSSFKDSGSPFRDMTDEERIYFQELIDDLYNQFVEAVSVGREIPIEEVKDIANGKIYSGKQAQKIGLVDTLGSLNDVVEYIKLKNKYQNKIKLINMPKKENSIFDYIFNILSYKLELSNLNYTLPQYLIVN